MKDNTVMKMSHKVLGRLKYITNREKSVKGLMFGDQYNNNLPDDVITGMVVPEAVINDGNGLVNAPCDLIVDDGPAINADATDGDIEELEEYKVNQEDNNSNDDGEDTQSRSGCTDEQ